MNFGTRAVERSSDERLGGLVDVAEFVLQGLQNGQQRAIHLAVLRNDFASAIRTPCLVRHLRPPNSFWTASKLMNLFRAINMEARMT